MLYRRLLSCKMLQEQTHELMVTMVGTNEFYENADGDMVVIDDRDDEHEQGEDKTQKPVPAPKPPDDDGDADADDEMVKTNYY